MLESHPKRPGTNSSVQNNLCSNSSVRVGESQGGTFLLSQPGKVGSDLAFAFGVGIIEGENKAALYFSSPFAFCESGTPEESCFSDLEKRNHVLSQHKRCTGPV